MSTGHPSFVRSTRQRLPRSTPGQQPGTFGRGPPSQSGHRRQSISSLRSLQFAAWSSAAPLAGVRGVQGGRHPPCSGCVVVSPASVALARRSLHARRAVLHDLDAALPGRLCRAASRATSAPSRASASVRRAPPRAAQAAGKSARAVSWSTPRMMEIHERRLASCCAPRHCRHSTPPSSHRHTFTFTHTHSHHGGYRAGAV